VATLPVADFTEISGDCTCTNYLRGIDYRVTVSENSTNPHFDILSVSADVIIGTTLTTACSAYTNIPSKFTVEFAQEDATIQYKSGNPGYIVGMPLLVGRRDIGIGGGGTGSGAIQAYQRGFPVTGADYTGRCYLDTAYDALKDNGDPVLNFGENLVYGCAITMTEAEFQSYCTSGDMLAQRIFT